jgi:trk system potassium uptake protein TrkH
LDRTPIANPERLVPLAFLAAIAAGTLLLSLPMARAGLYGEGAPFHIALFTATSAVCITGLTAVDTGTYWSPFGQVVILLLIQLGGLGIMSGATLLGVLITRRLSLARRLAAQTELRSLQLGDVAAVVRLILIMTLVVEAVLFAWLTLQLHFAHGEPWGLAAWHGLFHAVSAFNNGGFSIYPGGIAAFRTDGFVLMPLMLGVIIGGIGFPVVHELRTGWRRPVAWSIHTKLTLLGTAILLVLGFLVTLAAEWANPGTLGPEPVPVKLLGAAFHSVMTRSGGFNVHDVGAMNDDTILMTYGLMLVGGGSAGTAGGIKVTTFLLLGFVVWAEIKGEADTNAFGRRICPDTQRQALAIVLLAVGIVGVASAMLVSLSGLPMRDALFETISAFATVGLSTGVTGELPPPAHLLLTVLMFIGRVGSITVAASLALRVRVTPYRYPEERPIVG